MSYHIHELRDAALTLENDSAFYSEYIGQQNATATTYRNIIRHSMKRLRLKCLTDGGGSSTSNSIREACGREQLRRYFHERYGMPPPPDNSSCRSIVSVDFWSDDPAPTLVAEAGDPSNDPATTAVHQSPTQPKEDIMSIIKIETKTFVNGADISTWQNGDIYDLIAKQEAEIKKLEAIENKPKRLTTEIEERKAGIAALVAELDARDAK